MPVRSFLSPLLVQGVFPEHALMVLARHDPRILKTADKVRAGAKLSDAMGESPDVFDPTWVAAVRSGEMGGNLDDRMSDLVFYDELLGSPPGRLKRLYPNDVPMLHATRRLTPFTTDMFRAVEHAGEDGFLDMLDWLLEAAF
jgi:hypothetical protein